MFDGMSTPELFFLFLAAGAGFLGVRHLIQVVQARQQAPAAKAPREPAAEAVSDWPEQAAAGQASDSSQWCRRGADEPSERPWYTVLEVSPTAPMEDIRQAYKRKMRQYHPDKLAGLGPEFLVIAEQKTREINQAYEKAQHGR